MYLIDGNLQRVVLRKILQRRAQFDLEIQRGEREARSFAAHSSLLELRLGWHASCAPRFVYKYRNAPDWNNRIQVERLGTILLRHELWMAAANRLNDPMDSVIQYKVTLRGAFLREELIRFNRRVGDLTRAKAERLISSDMVANPHQIEVNLRRTHERLLSQWGVCSLSATARGIKLWEEYSARHTGLCFQFQPPRDLVAFLDLQEVTYSDELPVMQNPFGRSDEVMEQRLKFLMKKYTKWDYEAEWRLVGGNQANTARHFDPRALTGVIFGAAASLETIDHVERMLQEREEAIGRRPITYQARITNGIVRIERTKRHSETRQLHVPPASNDLLSAPL
jgi:hypothetical protein